MSASPSSRAFFPSEVEEEVEWAQRLGLTALRWIEVSPLTLKAGKWYGKWARLSGLGRFAAEVELEASEYRYRIEGWRDAKPAKSAFDAMWDADSQLEADGWHIARRLYLGAVEAEEVG